MSSFSGNEWATVAGNETATHAVERDKTRHYRLVAKAGKRDKVYAGSLKACVAEMERLNAINNAAHLGTPLPGCDSLAKVEPGYFPAEEDARTPDADLDASEREDQPDRVAHNKVAAEFQAQKDAKLEQELQEVINQLAYDHNTILDAGNNLVVEDKHLLATGIDPKRVTLAMHRTAHAAAKERGRENARRFNKMGRGRQVTVLEGDHDFDPALNSVLSNPASLVGTLTEEEPCQSVALTNGRCLMFIREKSARIMLMQGGYDWAEECSAAKLTKKLNSEEFFKEFIAKQEGDLEGSAQVTLKRWAAAWDEGEQVELQATAEGNGKPESMPKAKASEKNGKVAKKTKKVAGEGTDKYGSRIGSDRAKVNAVLGKKPKTMAEIMEETKLRRPFYRHLGKLVEDKKVKKIEEGYCVA